MKLKFSVLFLAICLFCPGIVFSQGFSRVLEVRPNRMNGQDVVSLQRRLISHGFSEIGDADGYYGPRIEQTVKNIQKFSGFEENGKVDRLLWEFIFSNDDTSIEYLAIICTVSMYDTNTLYSLEGGFQYEYWNHFGCEYTIYYSSDGKIRILAINGGSGDYAYSEEYYFADFDKYILIHNRNDVHGSSVHGVYLRNENFARNMLLGKTDNDSSYEPGDDVLLGILYSLRFR